MDADNYKKGELINNNQKEKQEPKKGGRNWKERKNLHLKHDIVELTLRHGGHVCRQSVAGYLFPGHLPKL